MSEKICDCTAERQTLFSPAGHYGSVTVEVLAIAEGGENGSGTVVYASCAFVIFLFVWFKALEHTSLLCALANTRELECHVHL